ncbi:hypothetical protein N7537_009975 [Penicillium hordei]|uniref:Uncharacterized protein n=1 Tax=Penicillium hordei TaxID=40994 RepID=A0AAD6GVA2_9EURO|nr:uncharacterized protein N7537_009975 [Penicillium hordei]KAJ5593071.1 hypothetical protein N7537_009975 [Penicillium hordei]
MPSGLAGYRRARDDSSDESSSFSDKHRIKRARQDDDSDSFSSWGSDVWREVVLTEERSRNAPESSQLTRNKEDHEFTQDRLVSRESQGDKDSSSEESSEESSENEGVELTDNDSDSLGDKQLSVSFDSSEEDLE